MFTIQRPALYKTKTPQSKELVWRWCNSFRPCCGVAKSVRNFDATYHDITPKNSTQDGIMTAFYERNNWREYILQAEQLLFTRTSRYEYFTSLLLLLFIVPMIQKFYNDKNQPISA